MNRTTEDWIGGLFGLLVVLPIVASITFGGSIILKSHHEAGSSRLEIKDDQHWQFGPRGIIHTEGVTAAAPLLLHCEASVDEACDHGAIESMGKDEQLLRDAVRNARQQRQRAPVARH